MSTTSFHEFRSRSISHTRVEVNHPVLTPVHTAGDHPVNIYVKYQVKLELKHDLNNLEHICALRWASALTSSFTRALREGILVKRMIMFCLQCSLISYKISPSPEIFATFLLFEAEACGGASSYLRIAHV